MSSDTITLRERQENFGFSCKGGGDGGFFLNDRDSTDGDATKTSFADLNKIRSNGDQTGLFRTDGTTFLLQHKKVKIN